MQNKYKNMKNIITYFLLLISSNSMSAVNLINGSLDALKNEHKIAISLDCSKCVYRTNNKNLPLEYFLAMSQRSEDWEVRSLNYFVENFNEETLKEGLIAVVSNNLQECQYELIILPKYVFRDGSIEALIHIIDHNNNSTIAKLAFKADGDEDDKITFRDPLRDAGEEVGKLFGKVLRGKKIKIKNQRSRNNLDDIYY